MLLEGLIQVSLTDMHSHLKLHPAHPPKHMSSRVVQSAESSRLPVILPCEMVEKSAS